jgi:hypothetical protein
MYGNVRIDIRIKSNVHESGDVVGIESYGIASDFF